MSERPTPLYVPEFPKRPQATVCRSAPKYNRPPQGWPYSWLPYAPSGDPRYLKFAEAATRALPDTCYYHYSDHKTANRPRGIDGFMLDKITFIFTSHLHCGCEHCRRSFEEATAYRLPEWNDLSVIDFLTMYGFRPVGRMVRLDVCAVCAPPWCIPARLSVSFCLDGQCASMVLQPERDLS